MRLIDADALMEALGITDMDCEMCELQSGYGYYCSRSNDFIDACIAIEQAPTIDLVRCEECRYLKHDADYQWCGMIGVGCEKVDDDYCSYGERDERTL